MMQSSAFTSLLHWCNIRIQLCQVQWVELPTRLTGQDTCRLLTAASRAELTSKNIMFLPHRPSMPSKSSTCTLNGQRFHFQDNVTLYQTRQTQHEASERITTISIQAKQLVLCKWTKYGNWNDKKGVLAAPSQIYIILLKKICHFFF